MIKNIAQLQAGTEENRVFKPVLLRLTNQADKDIFDGLIADGKVVFVNDEIYTQLQELVKSLNPSIRIKADDYPGMIADHLKGNDIDTYGVWAYYPWSKRLVHLLDEEEFVEVRTNRNQYKITRAERDTLATKRIGIVGLSVGQSIALTLSMERAYGELRLADFDVLELSNLNRIRTGLHNMGVPKVVIAAREIAEIDPYLKVTCFFEGLTDASMDDFFLKDGKLDLFVDECDGLDIKILSRFKARELGIPVIMDTSDRGMLDVERFDLEPTRDILHGTVQNVDPGNIKELTNEEKIPIILQMLGIDNVSLRAQASMVEVEQTINTWPQLASSVTLGGAIGADVARRILLDQYHDSGRYYIDLEELISNRDKKKPVDEDRVNPYQPLTVEEMKSLASSTVVQRHPGELKPDQATIRDLVKAANAAPSTGNDQPWKWLYNDGVLSLYHDKHRSFSFGDYRSTASFITFGAVFENLYVHALTLGLEAQYQFAPVSRSEQLVAAITFNAAGGGNISNEIKSLDTAIYNRHTNRNPAPKSPVEISKLEELKTLAESIPGARLKWFTDDADLKGLGEIIGACDRIRLLNKEAHHDFVHHEMRWTTEDAERTLDGIDIKTLGLTNSQLAALGVIKNKNVVHTINQLGGGKALDMLAKRTIASASALCLITLPKHNLESFFEGGRAMERFWLGATNLGIAVHPVISPLYIFPRVFLGNGEGLTADNVEELKTLREKFIAITGVEEGLAEVFLAKIAIAPEPELKSHRLPVEKTLIFE